MAESSDEAELRFVHLRPMGSSQGGTWEGRKRWGVGQWFMGTSPFYVLVSSINRMRKRPFVIGGIGIFFGYWKARLSRQPQYHDIKLRMFLRRYHRLCLVVGKPKALKRIHEEGKSVWQLRRYDDDS